MSHWEQVHKLYLDTYACQKQGTVGFQGNADGPQSTHKVGKVIQQTSRGEFDSDEQEDFMDSYNHFLNVNINFAAGPSWGIQTPYWQTSFENLPHSANDFFKEYNSYAKVVTREDHLLEDDTLDCNEALIYDAKCLSESESEDSKCRFTQLSTASSSI